MYGPGHSASGTQKSAPLPLLVPALTVYHTQQHDGPASSTAEHPRVQRRPSVLGPSSDSNSGKLCSIHANSPTAPLKSPQGFIVGDIDANGTEPAGGCAERHERALSCAVSP